MKSSTLVMVIAVWLAALMLLSSGCTSSEEFYEDAGLSRDMAYNQWKQRREQKDKSQTIIYGKLNLEDCIKLALVNNKTLQRVVEEKEIARGGEMVAYSAILPAVSISSDYTHNDEVSSFNINGQKVSFGALDNYSAGLRVSQPFFAGGSIIATINSGKLQMLLANQAVRNSVQTVIYEAAHGYYDVLLNQQLYDNSAEAVHFARAQLNDVKQKRQGGVSSDFDVLRAEVELSNGEAELIQNKNAIYIAKANLLKVMGISQDSNFVPLDELTYMPLDMKMEQAVETAYKNRPDLFSSQFDIKLQKEYLKISQSRYWPTVSGFYDFRGTKPDPHNSMNNNWGSAWDLGVMATYPLFDGFARQGEVIQQRARLKQSQINLIDTEETALLELTKALFSIQNTAEFVESQKLNLVRAKEGLRLAQVRYKEGTNTELETIDAQAALTKARAFYYQAIYSHLTAKLDLHKAMGILAKAEAVMPQNAKEIPPVGNTSLESEQEQQ